MNGEDIVVGLVAFNGGKLVGRTRLQKQAYLLDRCGANLGLQFTYHHYGPYSFELAAGCVDAKAEGRIDIKESPGGYGVPYATFKSMRGSKKPGWLGELPAATVNAKLKKIRGASDIVLELAATIVFLRDEWNYYGKGEVNPVEETKARKSLKATDERIEKALKLIHALDLEEASAPAT